MEHVKKTIREYEKHVKDFFADKEDVDILIEAYYTKKNILGLCNVENEYTNYYIIIKRRCGNILSIDFQTGLYEKYEEYMIIAEIIRQIKETQIVDTARTIYRIEKKCCKNKILFSGESAGFVIHEIVGHLSEGRNLKNWKIGEKLFEKNVSVIDDPNIKNYVGSLNYDDEGVRTIKKEIVKNGIINQFLLSSSDIENEEYFGNARCEDFSCFPRARMSNTYLINTSKSSGENFGEEYIYVYKIKNGGINYLLKEVDLLCEAVYFYFGQTYKMPLIFIREDIEDFFEKIVMFGKKVNFANCSWCIKDNKKPIPVKYGSTKIAMSSLNISFVEN